MVLLLSKFISRYQEKYTQKIKLTKVAFSHKNIKCFLFYSDESSVCLDDYPVPSSDIESPIQLPGEIYDAETQCKWQFGDTARICDFRYRHEQVLFRIFALAFHAQ